MRSNQTGEQPAEKPKMRLVLHIEVPGVWADDLPQTVADFSDSDEPTPQDYLDVVLEEWMREEVGLTIVTQPGWGEMNEDFMVVAHNGRIVGAEARPIDGQARSDNRPVVDEFDWRSLDHAVRVLHTARYHAEGQALERLLEKLNNRPNRPEGGADRG